MPNSSVKIEQRSEAALAESSARRHENRVLASLPQADLAYLARHLHVVSFQPGTILQRQDEPFDFVYFPHEGLVSLLAMTSEGKTVEGASVGRTGAICPVHDFSPREGFLTAAAQGAMRASRLAASQYDIALKESEAFGRALRACREALVFQLRQNVVCSGLHTVEQRLSRWLLETADRLESNLVLVTQEHVALRLGVRRTTVTLIANKLQDGGAINWGRSRVELLDRSKLVSRSCCCYADLRERLAAGTFFLTRYPDSN